MALIYGPKIPLTGLALNLDAGDANSYPGTGTAWRDTSGTGTTFAINASAYNSSGPKYMDFNGSYGCAKKTDSDFSISGNVTAVVWTRIKTSTAEWRTLFRALSSGNDHQVIVQSGAYPIGMFDNDNGTGFNSSGYSQNSLPGWNTGAWNMLVWRWNNAATPYYNLSVNGPTVVGTITSINARFKTGFCSIGAYNNGSQSDVNNASQYWGDISQLLIYTRYISDSEVTQIYNTTKSRFGL
jgi:hypothetical protein